MISPWLCSLYYGIWWSELCPATYTQNYLFCHRVRVRISVRQVRVRQCRIILPTKEQTLSLSDQSVETYQILVRNDPRETGIGRVLLEVPASLRELLAVWEC